MFVHNSPPQPYAQACKPLPALHSNVLAESESCLHFQLPASPEDAYRSPLHKQIQDVFHNSPGATTHASSSIPLPVHVENRTHEVHRSRNGLGAGLSNIGKQADLLHRSNSNSRSRNQTASFQPQKRAKGSNSRQLKQFAEATLGSGSLKKVVHLPEGESRDEWLAVNSKTDLSSKL